MAILRLDGAWYCDARPDGAYVALIPGLRLDTHRGPVLLPPGGDLLYVRIAPDGIRFAGQGHDDDRVWEWTGTAWRDRGHAYGVSPVIYDNFGTLRFNDGSWGSQGARQVDEENVIWTGDDTYFAPTMELSEFSWLYRADIAVGQSHPDGTNDAAWVCEFTEDEHGEPIRTLRLLEPGPCRFIRAHRDGDRVSIAIWKPHEGAVIYWLTLAEIRSLPIVTLPGPPPPPPDPEPPMELPDPGAVFAALSRERDKYPARVTNDDCGAIVYAAAQQFPYCGMHKKTGGEYATLPNGEKVNRNVMRYLPPGDDFGWWSDVLGAAGAGIASPQTPDWQRSTDDRASFVPAVGATPPPPPPPPSGDLESRVAALERWMARVRA